MKPTLCPTVAFQSGLEARMGQFLRFEALCSSCWRGSLLLSLEFEVLLSTDTGLSPM